MRRGLMMVSLLGLSAGWASAQPAPELFKLHSSGARIEQEVEGTCKPFTLTIASFATNLGGTSSVTSGSVRITFPKDKRVITLTTQPQHTHCTTTIRCENPEGGGAEALCQEIQRLLQDLGP